MIECILNVFNLLSLSLLSLSLLSLFSLSLLSLFFFLSLSFSPSFFLSPSLTLYVQYIRLRKARPEWKDFLSIFV